MSITRLFILCVALLSQSAWAANLGVTPVAVYMSNAANRATVSIVNYGDEPVTMQVEGIEWTRVNGVDKDGETSDIMVNPAVFTVEPGDNQIIRVGMRKPANPSTEGTYRLVLREVPVIAAPSDTSGGTNVRVLVAMRIPIYVSPTKVVRDENWKVNTDGKGNIVVKLNNNGNVHYKVGGIKLRPNQDKESAPLATSSEGGVIFPGETRAFNMRSAQPLANKSITLEVFTDIGPQYVTTEIARGD
jgi:fimbrial chaperone protein